MADEVESISVKDGRMKTRDREINGVITLHKLSHTSINNHNTNQTKLLVIKNVTSVVVSNKVKSYLGCCIRFLDLIIQHLSMV